jgi:two-component system response regulator AtoC
MLRKNLDRGRMRILVVEDDEIMLMSLLDRLKIVEIDAVGAGTLNEARWWLGTGGIDLVVSDIRLPDGSGRDLFIEISRLQPGLPFILMTAFGSISDAVALVKAGAVDYLEKPFDLNAFIALVRRILSTLSDMRLASESVNERYRLGSGLLGHDPSIHRIERSISRIRDIDAPVMISGETGTGKKHVAMLIHYNSHRAERPFLKLNCAPWENDIDVEESFSASLDQARGGTLFLDEVAELSDRLQGRLLETISTPHPDVRIIASRRIEVDREYVERPTIRPDLLWRLDVIHIKVPPLRERPSDIVHLARHFLAQAPKGVKAKSLSAEAEAWLRSLKLPGNGRELRRLISKALSVVDGVQLERHHLEGSEEHPPPPPDLKSAVEDAERKTILSALTFSDGSISKAAEALGISRKNLWEKMHRLGIER